VLGGLVALLVLAGGWEIVLRAPWSEPTDGATAVLLHGGLTDDAPANSRTAVEDALAHIAASEDPRVDGIEVDVVLTGDGVLVLHHDPWIDPARCSGLPEGTLVRDVTVAVLRGAGCYGTELLTLPALLELLSSAPGVAVFLDVKIQAETRSREDTAAALTATLGSWAGANPLWIEVPDLEALAQLGPPVRERAQTLVSFPPFPTGTPYVLPAARTFFGVRLGLSRPTRLADRGADGLVTHSALIPRRLLRQAQEAGLQTVVFPVNDLGEDRAVCDEPYSALITDAPAMGGCPD